MPNYKITIEYVGTPYKGWQIQKNLPTIQGTIELAIKKFSGEKITIQGSGRTDSGVHALAQVANFKLQKDFDPYKLLKGVNFYLSSHLIAIIEVKKVDDNFHARFCAQHRKYVYKIINRAIPLTLQNNRAWHVFKPLNIDNMQKGANYLIGTHDFSSFRAKLCQAPTPIRIIRKISILQDNQTIEITISGKSFLHHQVRNIVGSLKLVGEGKWKPEHIKTILKKQNRIHAGPTAPAHGLYFHSVSYNNVSSLV